MSAVEFLDELDAARASIGDSPAFRVVGFVQDDEDPEQVLARFDDEGTSVFAECYGTDAAALIVAAVNALPKLTAAVRGCLRWADQLDREALALGAMQHDLHKAEAAQKRDAAAGIRSVVKLTLDGAA